MNRKNKDRLIFFGIYSLLIISAVGSMAGTYAWYEYRSRATSSFRGTAIKNARKLEVGVVSSVDLPNASDYGLTKDNTNPNVYWSNDGVSANTLDYFLRANGYATNMLTPVTSGRYNTNDVFTLKSHPIAYESAMVDAKANEYVHLPLAFRVNTQIADVKTFDVRLTDAIMTGVGSIKNSARINVAREGYNFIFNPSERNSGENDVGGALDLDLDGYRDYSSNTKKEFIYGEYDNLVYKDEASGPTTPLVKEDRTTFTGVTKEGIYAIDEDNSTFAKSQYLGRKDTLSILDCAKANESTNGIAYCNVTIYLEGWSLTTIDDEVNNYFNLDLQFELFND